MTIAEEKELIEKTLNGDNLAFEQLVIANQKNVYNLAVSITRNEQDALDVSQEVFLKAYTKLSSFRGTCKFSTWLYKINYNVSLDVIRNNKNSFLNKKVCKKYTVLTNSYLLTPFLFL